MSNTATIDIRRAGDRAATKISWLDSKHSFSFSDHYDPANTHHGLLLVNNDDIVTPGAGFETHPHRDMEIVTWVLRGSVVHQDSTGHSGVIYPGLAQRMSAGRGILHSEKNDSWNLTGGETHSEPVHFVQMWVVPDESGITPGYQQMEIDDELLRGKLGPRPVPQHAGGHRKLPFQELNRVRCLVLLPKPDGSVHEQERQDDEKVPVVLDERRKNDRDLNHPRNGTPKIRETFQ